jgi:hypothetical protein
MLNGGGRTLAIALMVLLAAGCERSRQPTLADGFESELEYIGPCASTDVLFVGGGEHIELVVSPMGDPILDAACAGGPATLVWDAGESERFLVWLGNPPARACSQPGASGPRVFSALRGDVTLEVTPHVPRNDLTVPYMDAWCQNGISADLHLVATDVTLVDVDNFEDTALLGRIEFEGQTVEGGAPAFDCSFQVCE